MKIWREIKNQAEDFLKCGVAGWCLEVMFTAAGSLPRGDWKLDLRCGDIELELFGRPGSPARVTQPEACGLRHLAFRVPDLDEAVRALAARGIACEPVRTDEFTGKRMTFFADPDGLPLEIRE